MAKLNRLKAVLAEQDKTSKWLAERVSSLNNWMHNFQLTLVIGRM